MKRQFYMLLALALTVTLLIGCNSNYTQGRMYDSNSDIAKEGDSWSFKSKVGPVTADSAAIVYDTFRGTYTLWTIVATEASTLQLEYDSKVSGGKFKVVVIAPDNTVTTLFEQGKDTATINLPLGTSRIKMVGDKASGPLAVTLKPGPNVSVTPRSK